MNNRYTLSLFSYSYLILVVWLPAIPMFYLLHTTNSRAPYSHPLAEPLTLPRKFLKRRRPLSPEKDRPYYLAFTKGVTLDSCRAERDCAHDQGSRICGDAFEPTSVSCPPNATKCVCLPTYDPSCVNDDKCDENESCAVRILDGFTFCVSKRVLSDNNPDVNGMPTYIPLGNGAGLTRDSCQNDFQCAGARICTLEGKSCNTQVGCGCTPISDFLTCATSWECPRGEVCARNVTGEEEDFGECVSRSWVEKSETFEEIHAEQSGDGEEEETRKRGLNYDRCSGPSDCEGQRICKEDNFGGGTECGDRSCRCFPGRDSVCQKSSECQDGEVCAAPGKSKDIGRCISETAVNYSRAFNVVQAQLRTVGGLTTDRCISDDDCNGNRVCQEDTPNSVYCRRWASCFCFRPRDYDDTCEKDGQCEEGEKCFEGEGLRRGPLCMSESMGNRSPVFTRVNDQKPPQQSDPAKPIVDHSPVPTEMADSPMQIAEGCVDVSLLGDLERGDLLYEEDVWARVLCDGLGNCATRGHIVAWRGRAMMMESYCENILAGECIERETWVNSPKWKKAMRVSGVGEDLKFTVFSAKWATRWEEILLRRIVHIGL